RVVERQGFGPGRGRHRTGQSRLAAVRPLSSESGVFAPSQPSPGFLPPLNRFRSVRHLSAAAGVSDSPQPSPEQAGWPLEEMLTTERCNTTAGAPVGA